MTKMSVVRNLYLFFFLLGLGTSSQAIPSYERTSLTTKSPLSESEQAMLAAVINLPVYKDSQDPNLYYYSPPLRIKQYRQGAASLWPKTQSIKIYAEAIKEIESRSKYLDNYTNNRFKELEQAIESKYINVRTAEAKLGEALLRGNQDIIDLYRQGLARETSFLNTSLAELAEAKELMQTKKHLVPAGLVKIQNERIVMKLAFAGFDVPYDGTEDPDLSFLKLKESVRDFSKSYGGYLSMNVYGGFSKAELDALIEFKQKYAPHIKVILLPIEKLTFSSLTEEYIGKINGSGDYLGANIVIDTTVAGSFGLVQHLAPFVPPVGIVATLKQQMEPTEARLNCDFSNGFAVYGRADVRDGKEVFDNDVTMNLTAHAKSDGACYLMHFSGDLASAEYQALIELEKKLNEVQLYRTNLSYAEKERYYKGVIDDVQRNRRDSRAIMTIAKESYNNNGWSKEKLIKNLSSAADYHWHTNNQNVNNIASLKFTQNISIHGHKTIEKALPLNLCLVYNPEVNAYDRCTELDETGANNVQKAIKEASESDACKDAEDPFDCGTRRDKAAPPKNGRASSLNDRALLDEI